MNASTDHLDPETHGRIFAQEIVPDNLLQKASHEHPKAIILAGQPGAGKGRLAKAAENELGGDLVTIDPDALRGYHPNVEEFQSTNPYTWSRRTHDDASQWANELREATVAEKKNLILDTTLSNGPRTADLIKDLQKHGYDVEVRAVAAHKLESEHGVDSRFSGALDRNGYGRYVPEDVRKGIYDKVPASLDTIRAQTDAPIRLFSREGKELYDSRTDARSPGQVLNEAREARLSDPKITRSLSQDWKEQAQWHENLPEAITHNPKVAPDTAQRLLTERRALNVVEGVQRNAAEVASLDYAVRIHPTAIEGLKVVGAAAVAYDATTTAARSADLLRQGNNVGAQSQVEHFAGRAGGGWAGAVAGAELFGTAGAETGPADLLIAGVGGVAGAIGGDKLMEWHDHQRIYNQTDPQGTSWHYDPKQPQQGWTRTVVDAFVERGMSPSHVVSAPPAVAERLTFQANNTAVDLALANPPTPRDPYTQPAGPKDAPSQLDAPWTRDAQTQQWSRTVTDEVMEHGLKSTHVEVANTQRAAELNVAAQQTIAENLANSPRGIAEHYQAVYQQHGWSQFGAMPEAVSSALKAPENTLQASDGHTYTRGQDGQWNTPGMLWGTNAATGNVRTELNATAKAETAATPSQSRTPPQLNDPDHPDYAMFQQAKRGVYAVDAEYGRTPDIHSDQLAAALTVASRKNGYNSIDIVMLGEDRQRMFANQGPAGTGQVSSVDTLQALNTPIAQSSQQWQQVVNQQQQAQAQQQAQIQAQRQTQQPQPQGPTR